MSWIERITRWLRQPRMQAAHGGPAGRRPAHGHGASSRRPQELCRSDGTPVLSGHFSDDELGRALYMAQHRLGVDLRGIELKNRRVTLSAIGARPIRLDMPGADLSGGWLMGGGTRLLAVSGDFSGTRLGNLRGLRFEESRLDRIVWVCIAPSVGRRK